MNDQEILQLSIEVREKLQTALKECDFSSQRHNIIDSVIWALEDLEQYISNIK